MIISWDLISSALVPEKIDPMILQDEESKIAQNPTYAINRSSGHGSTPRGGIMTSAIIMEEPAAMPAVKLRKILRQ